MMKASNCEIKAVAEAALVCHELRTFFVSSISANADSFNWFDNVLFFSCRAVLLSSDSKRRLTPLFILRAYVEIHVLICEFTLRQ